MSKRGSSHGTGGIGVARAWALALGCIIGWGAFVMPGTTFLPKAGPGGTLIAMLIAAAAMIVIAVNYHFMMVKHPVNGAVFTFTLQTFGRGHAFVCSWFLCLAYLVLVPQNATAVMVIARSFFGNLLTVGPHYDIAGYETYLGEVVMLIVIIALVALVILRGARFASAFQVVFVACLVAGVALVVIAAAACPQTHPTHIAFAFNPTHPGVFGVIGILAVAPWAFVGFDTLAQSAGDISFSMRKMAPIMIGAILMGAAIYVSLNTIAALAVPPGYDGWPAYIAALPDLSGTIAYPLFYVVQQTMGDAGLIALGIAALGATLGGMVGFTLAAARVFSSAAQGGVLPHWFAATHPKYGTPVTATIFIFGISVILALLGRTALGWLLDMSSIGAAAGFFYTSAAMLHHARQAGSKALVFTGAAGSAMAVVFILLLVVPIAPLDCSLSLESYVFLVAWIALGINFYTPAPKKKRDLAASLHLTEIDSAENHTS